MAAYGITQNDISLAIGIAPMTLRKHFADELATAHVKANARVSETAYNMAISGKCPAATFFWLKCRAGWRKTTHLEHTGADGAPLAAIECIERVIVHERASGRIIEGEAVADKEPSRSRNVMSFPRRSCPIVAVFALPNLRSFRDDHCPLT